MSGKLKPLMSLLLVVFVLGMTGCGDPPLHKVEGNVTLGGKSYNRLLVYFRPIDEKVNQFNMGVGETDATGRLALRSTAGDGLQAGKYRVSFSCMQSDSSRGNEALGGEKLDDDRDVKIVELVPSPYDAEENMDQSPLEFEVKSGVNVFDFDIPKS